MNRAIVWMSGWVTVAPVLSASGAELFLSNDIGAPNVVLGADGTGVMQIRLTTNAFDTVQVAFISVFLDTPSTNLQVTGLAQGQPTPPWTYDRSAFDFPALLDCDNLPCDDPDEYGLIMGDQNDDGGFPIGESTWILDSIFLFSDVNEGVVEVTFELGAREPSVSGPAPDYFEFPLLTPECGTAPSNTLQLGIGNSDPFCDQPLTVDTTHVPEPSIAALLATPFFLLVKRRN